MYLLQLRKSRIRSNGSALNEVALLFSNSAFSSLKPTREVALYIIELLKSKNIRSIICRLNIRAWERSGKRLLCTAIFTE